LGRFIRISIDVSACPKGCRKCIEVCPVDIFALEDERAVVRQSEEDECTLCELCLQRCPAGAIKIEKLYL
jgi:NAD-dependent dihydropyrimidine dehydrogenase PreA subunit